MGKYPHLLEPFAIGDTVFRNRIFASPQGYYNVGADNLPGLDEIAFFERKALGGYASVCVGDCIVDSATGTHYPFLIRMDDTNTLPGLSALAGAITRNGAAASAELSHGGMYARFVKDAGGKHFGPNAAREFKERRELAQDGTLYGPVHVENGKYGEVEEMPEEMILHIVKAYGEAAAWAKRCGFNMVTVHGGHGWLLNQFMSPVTNTRGDRWGGSFDNRMRFTLAVLESIRKNVGPRFPVEFRMSGTECSDRGYDITEGIRIAGALDGKVDIIHVSAGHHEFEESFIITHPSMFLPDGVNVKYAAEIKKHVKTPVAAVGALCDPMMMEEIIASGQADIVELGRQTLADPDLPVKTMLGREDEINKCLRCCTCFSVIGRNRVPQCTINPVIGHELEEKFVRPAPHKRRVLVAGGGPGGMQAALTAARQGHEVILCEKSHSLGGVLRCEGKVPFKKHLEEYLSRQAMLAARAGVQVRLDTEVTPEAARAMRPDVIIAALGAVPVKPRIPGIGGANVLGAQELYVSPEKAGERLVILGGGLVGLELAIFMAGRGSGVTVVEIMDGLGLDAFGMHATAVLSELDRLAVTVRLKTRVSEITAGGVRCEGPDGPFTLPADTVAYATGQSPRREEAFGLHDCAPEFYMIGDCASSRNIHAATQEAHTVAQNIGRI